MSELNTGCCDYPYWYCVQNQINTLFSGCHLSKWRYLPFLTQCFSDSGPKRGGGGTTAAWCSEMATGSKRLTSDQWFKSSFSVFEIRFLWPQANTQCALSKLCHCTAKTRLSGAQDCLGNRACLSMASYGLTRKTYGRHLSFVLYIHTHISTCILSLFKILGCHVSLLLSVPLVFVSQ